MHVYLVNVKTSDPHVHGIPTVFRYSKDAERYAQLQTQAYGYFCEVLRLPVRLDIYEQLDRNSEGAYLLNAISQVTNNIPSELVEYVGRD